MKMILKSQIKAVRVLLEKAAAAEATISFPQLFACFSEDTRPADVYDTLEAVCFEICDWNTAIYSVLLAKKGDGLPGDGFFDIFRNHRAHRYFEIASKTHVAGLTIEQRQTMTQIERMRVYQHAKDNS